MVKLFCAIFGVAGSAFPVNIDESETVGDLKEVIWKKIKEMFIHDDKFRSVVASNLQLSLAKTEGGAWLTEADVKNGVEDTTGLKPLNAARARLRRVGLSDGDVGGVDEEEEAEGRGPVNVLVVVPEGAVDSASETSKIDLIFDKVVKLYEHSMQSKRTRYIHSEMSSKKGSKLVKELKIHVTPVDAVPFTGGSPTPVEEFKWKKNRTEEQQSGRYRDYVEANIGDVLRNNKLCVLGVEKGADILSVEVPGCDVDLVGRTDMIVLSAIVQKFPHYLRHLPGVRMLIEVKREVKSTSVFQALSELIALDFIVDESVMALLTNLTNHWEFLWVSNKSDNRPIIATTTLTTPGEAFEVIRKLLVQSSTVDTDIMLPCLAEPVKRRKLNQMFPFIGEASGD